MMDTCSRVEPTQLQQCFTLFALLDQAFPLFSPLGQPRPHTLLVQHVPHPLEQPVLILGNIKRRQARQDGFKVGLFRRDRFLVCPNNADGCQDERIESVEEKGVPESELGLKGDRVGKQRNVPFRPV